MGLYCEALQTIIWFLPFSCLPYTSSFVFSSLSPGPPSLSFCFAFSFNYYRLCFGLWFLHNSLMVLPILLNLAWSTAVPTLRWKALDISTWPNLSFFMCEIWVVWPSSLTISIISLYPEKSQNSVLYKYDDVCQWVTHSGTHHGRL